MHAKHCMSILKVGVVLLKLGAATRVLCVDHRHDLHVSHFSTDKRCCSGQCDTNDQSLLQFEVSETFTVSQKPQKQKATEGMKTVEGSTHDRHESKPLLKDASVAEIPRSLSYWPRGNPFTGRSFGAPFPFYFLCFLALKCYIVFLLVAWRQRVCQLRVACEDFIAQQFDVGLLGMMVSIQNVNVHPITARIQFSRVALSNPPGYESEYLLRAEEICVDIDIVKLILGDPKKLAADRLQVSGLTAIVEKVCCKMKRCQSSNIEDAIADCCAQDDERDDVERKGLLKTHDEDGRQSVGVAEELHLRRVLVQDVHVLQHGTTGRESTQRVKANTKSVEFSSFSEVVGKTKPICLGKHLLRVVLLQISAADAASSHHHSGCCCCCVPNHF